MPLEPVKTPSATFVGEFDTEAQPAKMTTERQTVNADRRATDAIENFMGVPSLIRTNWCLHGQTVGEVTLFHKEKIFFNWSK